MKQGIFHAGEARTPLAVLAATIIGGMLLALQAKAADLSGTVGIASDYVWRGTTQTQGDPAVQAGFKLAGPGGLYASAWGSNVEFAPETHASSEFDLALGWNGNLSADWSLDAYVLHYRYPSTTTRLNWTELNGSLTYKGKYWLAAGYSNDVMASNASGAYTQLGARFPLNDALRIEAAVGHYRLDRAYGDSYTHAQLGATWAFMAPFELRLTAHDTDGAAERLFPGLAGPRIEAALQAGF